MTKAELRKQLELTPEEICEVVCKDYPKDLMAQCRIGHPGDCNRAKYFKQGYSYVLGKVLKSKELGILKHRRCRLDCPKGIDNTSDIDCEYCSIPEDKFVPLSDMEEK